jgi:hypothetical protein
VHSHINRADSGHQRPTSIREAWAMNATPVIGGGLGSARGGKPETSLRFIDENTIVASFVTQRKAQRSPQLSRRSSPDGAQPWELHTLFVDAATGRVTKRADWPVESRFASVVASHDGKIVVLRGKDLVLYSSSLEQIGELRLPPSPLRYSANVASVSPTGQTFLFTNGWATDKPVIWMLVKTDDLRVLRSWQEPRLGRVSVSDSDIAMVSCTLWFYKCDPKVEIRGFDTPWRELAPISDRSHPPLAVFIGNGLIFLLGHSSSVVQQDGSKVFAESDSPQGCWWGGVYPSADGQRFVIPSCQQKGRLDLLDMAGYEELKHILVYDAPFHGSTFSVALKGPGIRGLTQIALSPTGSKLALLNDDLVRLFELPPVE